MAKVLVTEQYLEDIADAIRTKLSVGTVYTPGQMAAAILSIVSGEGGVENIAYSNGTLSKTINGATSTVFTADSTPTSASANPVTSGGVYTSISAANAQISNILGDMATVEATSTASKNYEIGEYLVLDGVFYEVTVAIAQNGTITPGTNCTQRTVGEVLASLNSNLTSYLKVNIQSVTVTFSGTIYAQTGVLATTISGYTPIGIVGFSVGNHSFYPLQVYLSSGGYIHAYIIQYAHTTVNASINVDVFVLYKKE